MGKHERGQVAAEIRDLMALLDLQNSEQVAALLRNPGEVYPSGGLIRTYLNQTADAADKFVRLLRARRAEVDAQLIAGVQAVTIGETLHAIYKVEPKQHVITILSQDDLDRADYQSATNGHLTVSVLASLAVPGHWLHTCRICGRPFVARASRSSCCYRRDDQGRLACRLEARRRDYKAKVKKARKEARKGGFRAKVV